MAYIGEIRMFSCKFAPQGWASCNGAYLPIRAYPGLFSVIGTTYGGNGSTTFALPNLAALVAMHFGTGPGLTPRAIGQVGGEPVVTLTADQLAAHSHAPAATIPATSTLPTGAIWSSPGNVRPAPNFYATLFTGPVPLNTTLIGSNGGVLAHNNLMPYLVVNFCIATQGDTPAKP